MTPASEESTLIEKAFTDAQIPVDSITVRRFPGETIVIVEVSDRFEDAVQLANRLDTQIHNGFITVKRSTLKKGEVSREPASLNASRVTKLIELLNARSRTSEQQPSLHYAPDATEQLSVATSKRHHLIFGRRGVGKTALMLETKRIVEERGGHVFWINLQVLRSLTAHNAFFTVASRICELPERIHISRTSLPVSVIKARALQVRIATVLGADSHGSQQSSVLVAELQELLRLLCDETGSELFIFLDDIHYLSTRDLPEFLDKIHAITRDSNVWIKAAGIKHLSRWFNERPPTGLQTGQDAAIINLDITLEDPSKAKAFLTKILKGYFDEAGVSGIGGAVSRSAIDRLVLASGGVPRDFMLLFASSLQVARQRENARYVGVQDVNEAAGRSMKIKIQELEDDAAVLGNANPRVVAFNTLVGFLLDQKQTTYFRVDFKDKEQNSAQYNTLQSLMDLRLVHLIHSSLSDEHYAGKRYEVYMLDLSQFSGTRFKRNLRVIDFHVAHLVLKSTGTTDPPKVGDTPKKLLGILRRAPLFELDNLAQN
jgi:hypothetical protein